MQKYQRLDVSRVDMSELIQWLGLEYNHKKSSSRAPVYSGQGRHIAVYNNPDKQIFVDLKQPDVKGDVFALVQSVKDCSFITAKELINDFLGDGYYSAPVPQIVPERAVNYSRFEYLHSAMRTGESDYLTGRGISPATQSHFRNLVRTDRNGTSCFYHTCHDLKPVGYEWKSKDGVGFSKGGTKKLFGLLESNSIYRYVVVCETAIDAMSFYQCHSPVPQTAIVSTGGHPALDQVDMLRGIAGADTVFVMAQDNDDGGTKQIEYLRSKLSDFRIVERRPQGCKDWNDYIRML